MKESDIHGQEETGIDRKRLDRCRLFEVLFEKPRATSTKTSPFVKSHIKSPRSGGHDSRMAKQLLEETVVGHGIRPNEVKETK